MKLRVTPTVDGELSSQYTTLINPKTGKPAELSTDDAIYWGNRAIQINEDFCDADPDFTVRLEYIENG